MSRHVEAMRALLNHTDRSIAAQGRQMVKASRDPAVRALLTKSPAGAACGMHGSRGPTGAPRQPRRLAATVPADGGKVARSATSPKPGSRWAHFAGLTFAAPAAEASMARTTMTQTPEEVAAFVAASAAKARGQKPAAAVKPPAAVKPDLSTPEGVAAFVAASAARARGNRR